MLHVTHERVHFSRQRRHSARSNMPCKTFSQSYFLREPFPRTYINESGSYTDEDKNGVMTSRRSMMPTFGQYHLRETNMMPIQINDMSLLGDSSISNFHGFNTGKISSFFDARLSSSQWRPIYDENMMVTASRWESKLSRPCKCSEVSVRHDQKAKQGALPNQFEAAFRLDIYRSK